MGIDAAAFRALAGGLPPPVTVKAVMVPLEVLVYPWSALEESL